MKKTRNFITIVLTILMLVNILVIVPFTANADVLHKNAEGKIDEVLSWILYNNGRLQIESSKSNYSMPDYSSAEEQPWSSYASQIKEIWTDSYVAGIGSFSFCNLPNVTFVSLSSVKNIGQNAFENCGLNSITIPENCISISVNAFKNCENLETIYMDSSYCEIGDSQDTFPSNVLICCDSGSTAEAYAKKYDKDYACDYYGKKGGCRWNYSRKTFTISGEGQMFYRFHISDFVLSEVVEKAIIEDGITSICDYAFSGFTEMTKVSIADSVKTIGNRAFNKCKNLLSVTLPSSLTNIGDEAFSNCSSLYSIKIPKNVKSIGENAFSDCNSLASVDIPDGVTNIGETAFLNCYNLRSVTIPKSVKNIGSLAFGFTKSSNNTQKMSEFTIYGASGSAADTYANDNNFYFVNISDNDISDWKVTGIKNRTYTGNVLQQKNILVSKDGEYANFTIQYRNNVNVGTATVIITGTGDYTGTITKTFKITKAANPMTVSSKQTVTANSKKKTTIKKAITVKKAQGKVTYSTNNKKVTVKSGTMTVAKGLKKGKTYSVKVTITAKGNSNYKSKNVVKTIKIKVK